MKKYIVREGDTMSSISKATGVRLNLLMAANPQVHDPNRLKPGTVVVIPELHKNAGGTNPAPQAKPTPTVEPQEPAPAYKGKGEGAVGFFGHVWPHVVQPGESWADIAQKYNVSMEQLFHLNPALQGMTLQDGEVVYVPGMVDTAPQTGMQAAPPYAPGAPYGPTMPAYPGEQPMPAYPGTPPMPEYPGAQPTPMYPGAQPMPEPYPYPYTYPQPGAAMAPGMVPYPPGTQPYVPMGPHTHTPYRKFHYPHRMRGEKWVKPAPTGYWAYVPYHPHMYPLKAPLHHKHLPSTWYVDWHESCGWAESWADSWSSSWAHRETWNAQDEGLEVECSRADTQCSGATDDAQPSERDAH
jgi:LysM repeat protein